jgi:hypothetical protein
MNPKSKTKTNRFLALNIYFLLGYQRFLFSLYSSEFSKFSTMSICYFNEQKILFLVFENIWVTVSWKLEQAILYRFLVSFGFCLFSTRVLNPLASQVLYHLSYNPSPFFFSYLSDEVSCYCLDQPQTVILLPPPPE